MAERSHTQGLEKGKDATDQSIWTNLPSQHRRKNLFEFNSRGCPLTWKGTITLIHRYRKQEFLGSLVAWSMQI